MANFKYSRSVSTKLSATGCIDTDRMTIIVDEDEKSLATLLSDFNGATVNISVTQKEDTELDEPVEE